MSILGKFETSGYGLSALDLNKSLQARALMQAQLQEIYSTTVKAEVDSSQSNAQQAQKGLENQADGMIQEGALGIAGGVAGFIASGVTYAMETRNLSKANDILSGTQARMGISRVEDTTNVSDNGLDDPVRAPNGAARVVAQNPNSVPAPSAPAGSNTSDPTANMGPSEKADYNRYQSNATWWNQHGSYFSNFTSQMFTSTGKLLNGVQTQNASTAKYAELIAQMEATVMKTVADNLTGSISGMNSFNDNTEQTITAIIRASQGA